MDDITAGFQDGDLIIIAGRPSMGKSSLALDITHNAVKIFNDNHQLDQQICAAFFSLEMGKKMLEHRLLCGAAGVNSREAQKGLVNEGEYKRLIESAARLTNLPIHIDPSPFLTPIQMRGKLRRLASYQSKRIGLIVVDYMQLMDTDRGAENRQQEMTTISRRLKATAKEFNVPLIAVSQLNRAVESRGGSKRPQLSDLRESGAIEQDADVVAFVYRPEYYLQDLPDTNEEKMASLGIAEIIIAKQRMGPTGTRKLHFNKELAMFSNLARDYHQQPLTTVGGEPF